MKILLTNEASDPITRDAIFEFPVDDLVGPDLGQDRVLTGHGADLLELLKRLASTAEEQHTANGDGVALLLSEMHDCLGSDFFRPPCAHPDVPTRPSPRPGSLRREGEWLCQTA